MRQDRRGLPCVRRAGSSPSSRRGSIAALTAGAGIRGGVIVVPVVTTGLHCGLDRRRGDTRGRHRRPRRHDGAPLRRHGPVAHREGLFPVVPVVTTGLHCGTDAYVMEPKLDGSSPSSRRGSIAASISATTRTSRSSRRPRRHDGAPLRRRRARPRRPRSHVVPVVTTGLHCGPHPWGRTATRPASRPRRHDGAPLRRDGLPGRLRRLHRRPRRHDGAPLRLLGVRGRRLDHGRRPRRHDGAPLRPVRRRHPLFLSR